MGKRVRLVVHVATWVFLIFISLLSSVYACQVDDFLLTKDGSLAATTPEVLKGALALGQDNQAKLTNLLESGTVLKLTEGVKVQVLERSVEWQMLKIQLPDGKATYWVKDGALKQIDCK
jgi:hypothetical protein